MQPSQIFINYLGSILIGIFLLSLFSPSILAAQDELSIEEYIAELKAYEAKLEAEEKMLISFGYAPESGTG